MPQTYGRNILPLYPAPVHYDLAIEGRFDNFNFVGEVTIALDLQRWQDEDYTCPDVLSQITFNAAEIELIEATIDKKDAVRQQGCFTLDGPVKIDLAGGGQSIDDENERITLTLPTPIAVGGTVEQRKSGEHRPQTQYGSYDLANVLLLTLKYKGSINDKMHGFYRSAYTVKGEKAFFGTTQFESCDCRRALPSWDEPLLKATFAVTLIVEDNGICALSNTHEVSRKVLPAGAKEGRLMVADGDDATELAKNKVAVSFDKTPRMSTYLLAWTIGHLEFIEKKIKKTNAPDEEVLVRIYTPEGKSKDGHFALDVACRTLPLYEKFFGSDYILSKCDLIAIPDFAAGAMENWGLITYRETALLCNDESSVAAKQRVALVVAHELAHQWFGNLVTMEWWMELWLNESFATWTEYYAVDVLFPHWQIFADFVIVETAAAFKLDALRSSHPVEVDVKNAQEIDEIFDAISYCKGGSIVRMVAEHIGLDALSKGLQKYLKHFEFGNANTVDLWNFLGEAAGAPLTDLLRVWTGVQGYPLIEAAQTDDKTMVLTQSRFLADKPAAPETETVWNLPLQVVAGRHDGSCCTLKPPVVTSAEATIDLGDNTAWAKLNHKQTCFCRVHYENKTLARITTAIEEGKMTNNFDRLGLVNDYHALAKGGYIPISEAIALLKSFSAKEDDYVVWAAISGFESDIRTMLLRSGCASGVINSYNTFCRNLYTAAVQRIGYAFPAGGDARQSQLRAVLLARLSAAEDAEAVATLIKFWTERETNPIPADVMMVAYAVAVKNGGKAEFEAMQAICDSTDATIRSRALRALGSTTDPELLKAVIDFVFSDKVRSQDAIYPLAAVAGNRHGGTDAYLDLLQNRWECVWKKFPGMLIGYVIKGMSSFISSDPNLIAKIEAWWASVPASNKASLERTYQQGLEELKNGLAWAARDGNAVAAAL